MAKIIITKKSLYILFFFKKVRVNITADKENIKYRHLQGFFRRALGM